MRISFPALPAAHATFLALLAASATTPASAAPLAAQEQAATSTAGSAPAATLVRRTLSLAGARQAVEAAKDEAARNGWRIAVAVVDAAGELVALEKTDGAIGISPAVAQGKARTAALLQAPSKEFEDFVNGGKPSFLSTPGVTPLEGGVPIVVDGQVVGAVGVSGAHGANDSRVACAAAAAVGR
ncbi:heme-binding protein [Stenotrophomonas sp. MMGLT7]|uniref:GlcG/HbpS family heme-binding protein n=1 Tax=Stenotrophomonas sp. MMGLT7 TaxID=2901227 RepID=UPI001E4D3BD8|nr:heme-binding protein [Stenotrophomonas sp. MMGLT7]MCD7096839.1 heme-binding protein [Stenotrophomonas sp. MMGLT7]